LVKAGADLKLRNIDGWNALHLAVRYGNIEIIKLLVEADESPVAEKTTAEETALHIASSYCDLAIVKDFVRIGLDPLEKEANGKNAVQLSTENGKLDNLKFLLQATANDSVHYD